MAHFLRLLTSLWGVLGRCLLVAGLVAGLIGFSAPESTAQAPSDEGRQPDSIEAITRVRVDADQDKVPDRVGDTVTVAGRITAQQGPFLERAALFLQDETAGIAVLLPDGPPVDRGDSLQVRGVVDQTFGLTQLDALDYTVVDAESHVPAPLPLTVTAAYGEAYEGRLVRVQGEVLQANENDRGNYLLLEAEDNGDSPQVSVFVPDHHQQRVQVDRFGPGDEIEATGLLAQDDRSEPYADSYQLWPREEEDLARVGILSTYVHTAIIAIIGAVLLAVVAVFTLRTVVKRRTQQLTESRARFRRLAEATFEGIIIHDDGEILDTNSSLAEMVGVDRGELVGHQVVDILSEEAGPRVDAERDAPPESPYEAVLNRENGTSIPVEIQEKNVTVGDRTVGVAAVRDISERKEREAEILLAKQEAEEMARLKSSLLNNMSHELRTPVTSIIGYAELIMTESNGPNEKFAARIRQSGRRLSETLRSVLEMAQIEAGTLELEARDVSMDVVAQEVVDTYDWLAEKKALSMEVITSEDCVLLTDRTLVYRILSNLVHNALKFTEEGLVRVVVESLPSGVQITVRDTGVGIHDDFQSQLFDPFKQESEGRGRQYEGTGLGLTLTKRMVELLGGTITVDSAKNEGSTFVVRLPPLAEEEGRRVPLSDGEEE